MDHVLQPALLFRHEGLRTNGAKAGKTAEAASWNACADKMYAAINKKFAEGNAWSLARENTGFFHDSMPLFYSDFVGLDLLQNMPQEWYERSQNTFDADMAKDPVNGTYFGPKGVSYDHGTITQNALLLDRTADAGKFLENLTKISYSPRLPQPYIVPECFSVDTEQGIYRRQGDLGNLVQLSEALKCYYVAAGVDAVRDGVLTIMPRLPEKWNLDFDNQDVTLAYKLPANNKQTITVTPKGTASTVKLRVGPFNTNSKSVSATVNGQEQQLEAFTAVTAIGRG